MSRKRHLMSMRRCGQILFQSRRYFPLKLKIFSYVAYIIELVYKKVALTYILLMDGHEPSRSASSCKTLSAPGCAKS